MEDKHIVTVDLGTSKIALTVAQVQGDNIQVLYYKEHESDGITKGEVFNEARVGTVLKAAKEQAEDALGITITQAAVSLPRYYVREITRQAEMHLAADTEISQDNIEELMRIAKDDCPLDNPDEEIVYDAVAQSYSDGETFQIKEEEVVGLEREKIEGNFKIFIGKKRGSKRIDSVFNKAGLTPYKIFPADHTARAVLSRSEMETGVALVEIGGGVTSVSVYLDNVMRYYGSFPFGGDAISSDIQQECVLGERLAEEIKKGYGICMPERLQTLADKKLHIRKEDGEDRQVAVKTLSEVVTARMHEIADGALYLIQESGLYDELSSGIVLTGGGANIVNAANLFFEKSGYATKVGYPKTGFETVKDSEDVYNPEASASIGLINAARSKVSSSFALPYAPIRTIAKPQTVVRPAAAKPQPVKVEEPGNTLFDQAEEPVKEPEAPKAPRVEEPKQPRNKKSVWDIFRNKEDKPVKETKKTAPEVNKPKQQDPNTGSLGGWIKDLWNDSEDNNV